MNKGVIAVLSFVAGTTVGAIGSWIFSVKRYQTMVDNIMQNRMPESQVQKPEEQSKSEELVQEPKPEVEPEPVIKEVKVEVVSDDPMNLENELQKKAAETARNKPDIINYNKMIEEYKYKQTASAIEDEEYSEYPYLITKDKIPFGEKCDSEGNPYSKITLIYYEDGWIADTTYEVIDDVDTVVGNENLCHFGDFPNRDSIFVRNDVLKEDIEVCKSMLTWEGDILERMPYLRGEII